MAELKKIVRNTQLSNFRQVAPEAGGAFRVLAAAADSAYQMLAPAAIKEQEAAGAEVGREAARRQIGDPASFTSPTTAPGISAGADTAWRSLQADWGRPLKVNSAYRSPEHNAKVGGAKNSQHIHGNAFDVDVSGLSQDERIDIITRARKAGFRGIGVYDNALHFDVGADRAWGASYSRDSLPAWAAGAVSAPVGGGAAPDWQPTTLRNGDGKLESRLYSPMAGPILQAHNAAAGVAYTSEVMLKGMTDLMQMSEQFPLNPQGFMDAARGYVDDMVKAAPEPFRADIRTSLEKETQRRFLGVMEDQQRDTRQRAANSSAALMERWGQNYAEALAAGNQQEADNALAELNSILAARETLPGLSWTRDQSDNVVLKAQDEADRIRQKAKTDQEATWKSALNTIIKAAKGGFNAADESILSDPSVQAANPELWREAMAFTALRDGLPSFNSSTQAQRQAAIDDLASMPVADDYQIDIVNAAKAADREVTAAFKEDQIAAAEAYLPEKPPALPDFTAEDPAAFVNALAARRAYVLKNIESGHFGYKSFLSDDEAKSLGALMGKDTPPEIKTLMSTALVSGFGEDARTVFSEIKSDDPVTLYAGMLQARGGSPETATAAMRGQAMIDQGLVQIPEKSARIEAVDPGIAEALSYIPNSIEAQVDLLKFATAIYANGARGIDPTTDAATQGLKGALQAALGQSKNKRGQLTGGVQEVAGHNVFLPVGVAGEDVQGALEKLFEPQMSFGQRIAPIFGDIKMDEARWASVGGVPMLHGKPVDFSVFGRDELRLIPVGGKDGMTYRMTIERGGGGVLDVEDATGNIYMLDLSRLLEAAQ